ncbi:MAG: DNA polymerase III subunit beta [Phycisphaerales bacterium]
MKVICDRAALLSAVNMASGVVATRTPRPQLTCIKLTARKSGKTSDLTLSATDGEAALRLTVAQVDVQEPGEAVIPADKLRQIVSAEEGDPTLTIETEDDACHIRGTDARFKVFGYKPSEFPAIPDFEKVLSGKDGGKVATFTHTAGGLSTMIARTLFATARENSRYAINGALLKRDGKKLEMVATDGRRLALARQTLANADKDGAAITCIVPARALGLMQRLMDEPEAQVRVAVTENQILVAIGSPEEGGIRAALASNLVEGAFPPYEEVIPKDQDKKVVFDRDVLSSAVRRAALLTNEESRGVRMKFKGAEKQLELSSRAPEMGEAEVNVELSSYEGADLEIGFNPTFITDALKVMTDPSVIMELKAHNRPGVVKSGNDFVYVVMPVNLQ